MFSDALLEQLACELATSERTHQQIEHFSKRFPGMSVDDGYRIARTWVNMQMANGRKVIPHTFIRSPGGRQNVFWRARGGDGKRVGRYPIHLKYGLALPEAFEWTSREAVEAQARDVQHVVPRETDLAVLPHVWIFIAAFGVDVVKLTAIIPVDLHLVGQQRIKRYDPAGSVSNDLCVGVAPDEQVAHEGFSKYE